MAREWLLRGVDPEELKPDEKIGAPETPKGWLENFWYHHKWAFLGGLFAVTVAAVLVTQLVTRDLPDYRLVLMTEQSYLPPQLEALEGLLAQYGQDLDGDGKVEVAVQNCCIGENVDQQYNSGFQQVQAHLMAGDVLFFAWDADAYETFSTTITNVMEADEKFLTALPTAAGVIEDGYVWSWEEDARRLTDLPDKLYFAVRDAKGTAEKETVLHQQCVELLEAFMLDQQLKKDEPMATVTGDDTTGTTTTTTTEAVETTTTTTTATKKAETTNKPTTTSATKAKATTTTTQKKATVVQQADPSTGISWDGKSAIVYTYKDGTTGTTPKDGATYEALPGMYTTYDAPKDVETVKTCSHCGRTKGRGQNGTCIRWLMGDADCPNCGEHVKSHTCHTCDE